MFGCDIFVGGNRRVTLILVAICLVSLAAAFCVGISGNPPGILLCYVSAASLILAFTHEWKKLWKFLILLGASLVGFTLFAFLHNLFYAFGELARHVAILRNLLEFLHVGFFLIAVFVCPAGFLVAAGGSAVMSFNTATDSANRYYKLLFILAGMCHIALTIALLAFAVVKSIIV